MGEYFVWANLTKKEKLSSDAFGDYGFMLSCSTCTTTNTTRAAETLMASSWKNDIVIYLGDYFSYDKCWVESNPKIECFFRNTRMREGHKYNLQYPWEVVLYEYTDIGGRFIESQGRKHTMYLEEDRFEEKEYEGPFDLTIKDFKFAVCETLKEYISLGMSWTDFSKVENGNFETLTFDPLPRLLCARDKPSQLTGRWAGFPITTTNQMPSSSYALLDYESIDDFAPQ